MADKKVWAFTVPCRVIDIINASDTCNAQAYKKDSPTKHYDGGGFHFSKKIVCFRPCAHAVKAGACSEAQQYGDDKCCVGKDTLDGDATVASQCEIEWANQNLGRKRYLSSTDGMKVF